MPRFSGNFEIEFDAKNQEHANLIAEMINSGYDLGHYNIHGKLTEGTLLPVEEIPAISHITRKARKAFEWKTPEGGRKKA